MRRLLIVILLMAATWTPAARSAVETGTIPGSVRLTSRVRGNAIPTAAYTPRAVERYRAAANARNSATSSSTSRTSRFTARCRR